MVSLLRAVKTSAVYRSVRSDLRSRDPDDVWFERDTGWLLSFPVASRSLESVALFVVAQPSPAGPARLLRALRVERAEDTGHVAVLH
jgi:hypothetical protein